MIQKVSIKPGCIVCRACENICPSIFKVNGTSTVINHDYKKHIQKILQARDMCPVQVIDVQSETWERLEIQAQKAVLLSKKYLTPDTLELVFQSNNFEFEPWQYISLKMRDTSGNFSRSYSISRGNKEHFIITVKILKNSRGGTFLHWLTENQTLEYLWPTGEFLIKNTQKHKVFIVTGTGLSPIIAMLESLDPLIRKTVIFWVRYEEDIYYKDILEGFENTSIIITVSKPWKNYTGKTGRVTDYLDEIENESEFYICGNPNMVESVKEKLKEKWVKDENVIFESFVLSTAQSNWWFQNICINGNIKWVKFLNWIFILLGFATPLLLLYGPRNYSYLSWDIAWWSVVFVMIIRPLGDIFPKYLIFKKLLIWRNGLGILSSAIILSHIWVGIYYTTGDFLVWMINYFTHYFQTIKWNSFLKVSARLSEITALLLFITSNNISQRFLWVWWKRVQRLAYVYFIAGGIYIYSFGKEVALYSMIVWVILYIIALIKNRKHH